MARRSTLSANTKGNTAEIEGRLDFRAPHRNMYSQGTANGWNFSNLEPKRVGVDLATLNFRLLDLCGKL